uniref:Carboxylic ester hydrolase n=1 Tax=Knipowitschia caucasica TaxID=637954 RepID=A0AAV2J389_KNICA
MERGASPVASGYTGGAHAFSIPYMFYQRLHSALLKTRTSCQLTRLLHGASTVALHSPPAQKWQKVLKAHHYSNSCYQLPDTVFPGFVGSEMWNPNTAVSEDCLYLNVWAPRNRSMPQPQPLLPVMVWIYGGGFTSGTASLPLYDGRSLSEYGNVVVVSMNYRLGAFGFLSLPNHPTIKGNAGLMDQQLALRWVSQNIAAFGGDPAKVTIFGESAGSASVGYQLLSPGSRDLFQRAVMQSGSPNAPWGHLSQTAAWERAQILLQKLKCPLSPVAKVEACLQKTSAEDIALTQFLVPGASLIHVPFAPIVDGKFLPLSVQDMLNSKDLPKKEVLFGLNKNEGTYFLPYGALGFNNSGNNLISREQFLQGLPIVLPAAAQATREVVISHYTDWTDQNNMTKNRDQMGNLFGDYMFVCPLLDFIHKYSQHGARSFLYFFDHRSSVNPWPEWMGAMHGYEIEFVFGVPLLKKLEYTKSEVNMTKKFIKHWTNFARTGDPSVPGEAWPSFTAERMEYVTLNYHHPEVKQNLKAPECRLWTTVVPEIQRISDKLLECSGGNEQHCSLLLLLLLVMSAIFQPHI